MSTPAPSVTFASELVAAEKKLGAFLDPFHIILVVLLAAALLFGVYTFESGRVNVAEAKSAAANAALVEAKKTAADEQAANKDLQAQKDAAIQQLNTANATLAAANSKLADAMKAEAAALVNQKKTDVALPPAGQAARWQQLVPTAVVTPSPTGFEINQQGGVDTLLALEEVPVLTSELAQANTQLDNDAQRIQNDAVVLQDEKDKHASDLKADGAVLDESHKETAKVTQDFKTYKKKAHRNLIRAYVAGVVTGAVLWHALGF